MVEISEIKFGNILIDFNGREVIVKKVIGNTVYVRDDSKIYTAAGLNGKPILTNDRAVTFTFDLTLWKGKKSFADFIKDRFICEQCNEFVCVFPTDSCLKYVHQLQNEILEANNCEPTKYEIKEIKRQGT